MIEKDRQYGTKFQLVKTNYIHNYIQGPFFGLKKWRKPLIYKDFRSGAGNRTWNENGHLRRQKNDKKPMFCSFVLNENKSQ